MGRHACCCALTHTRCSAHRNLLTYTKTAVTRNKSEKAILSILDTVSHSSNHDLLQEFYDTTLDSLREVQNEVRRPTEVGARASVYSHSTYWFAETLV